MKRIPASMDKASEGWKHLPLVKLGELLKQMVWFSGDYELNKSEDSFEKSLDPEYWAPTEAAFELKYQKYPIIIKCIWQTPPRYPNYPYPDEINLSHTNRFAIGVEEPYDDAFQKQRWRVENEIRYKYTRYYATALDKIEDFIHEAQEFIDSEIADAKEAQEQISRTRATKEKLCKSLDVKISSENMELFYREDDKYCLHFQLLDNGLFEIGTIGGEYDEKEIKKIIEIIGGNPRAIAERLSK